MSQKEAHVFCFFLVRSECQSCKLFLVVSIFAGLHFRFVCSSGFFFFWRDNGSAPSLQKRLRVNGSRGNLCGPASPVPMTAHWRQDGGMSCVFFFFFFFFPSSNIAPWQAFPGSISQQPHSLWNDHLVCLARAHTHALTAHSDYVVSRW